MYTCKPVTLTSFVRDRTRETETERERERQRQTDRRTDIQAANTDRQIGRSRISL